MDRLIDEIKLPDALKQLSAKQLEQVSQDVRSLIIDVTSKAGGHVAGSLGAVELAVALHASFESPRDKIIWDVGHQAYAHKILTGRKDNFNTLRQYKGISGFPNIDESPHDIFTVGHASTSISQALGLAHARDLNNENNSVVAVIGDGSLSGGLAFEGMNNAGALKTNMIVILNDNAMSISKNVGALSNYLVAVKTSDIYIDLRDRIEKVVKRLPKGGSLIDATRKLIDRTRHIVMSFKVDVIFEELGFNYFGPIDGHNIPLLLSTFHHAREIKGPVLIHVLTKKGKGYKPAEDDPTRFHGTGPFDILTGKPVNGKTNAPTYTQIFGQTVTKLAEKDPKIAAVTAAMIDGTGLDEFAGKFPKRFFDVGIAEEHAVTFCGALARGGQKPVVAIYSTFLQRAYDEMIHDVCLQKAPVVFAIDRAGIVGDDGATHNGVFDMAFLKTVPNLTMMAPSDENELQHMLFTAFQINGPVSIRYPRGESVGVKLDSELKSIEIGKGEISFISKIQNSKSETNSNHQKTKSKICIIAIGSMVYPSIEAAKLLEKDDIDCTVINARFIKPLDEKLILKTIKLSDKVVTVEEGVLIGGFGSSILDLLSDNKINIPAMRIGIPDKFIEHGKRSIILENLGLTAQGIYKSIFEGIKAL
ncbi:1-deoxy-D-xylulose-5-phosphate synthase [Candidatus Saganbacteria bacterium]|nr:1-deoxy-D-xylulose-5-phosphate synthase [Candidatus Saganbacteria bacterium]